MTKEILYFGHYFDIDGNFIAKWGTTNDMERRAKEHTRNYHKTPNYPMPLEDEFIVDFTIPMSKYNTLRYEDRVKTMWKEMGIGKYIRNDRFLLDEIPTEISITIRKEYIFKVVL